MRNAMEWVVLFLVIVILGALAGGNSFGETIRNGCGCLVLIVLGSTRTLFVRYDSRYVCNNGKFQIEGISPGTVFLEISANDYDSRKTRVIVESGRTATPLLSLFFKPRIETWSMRDENTLTLL